MVCYWTGTAVSIDANKVPGVRAPLCTDRETAVGARRWNDANVLAFGLRLTTEAVAEELVEAFLAPTSTPARARSSTSRSDVQRRVNGQRRLRGSGRSAAGTPVR